MINSIKKGVVDMKKTTNRVAIFFLIFVVAVVAYYAYLANKTKETKAEATMTLVQSTIDRDLVNNYPATPKEVIKYYNDIIKCFYNEEATKEELQELGLVARELYDEELLAANELGEYSGRLQFEINDYRDNARRISGVSVASSTDVDYFSEDGYEFARIYCSYKVSEGGATMPVEQVYLLRRDEDKHWKIYGWDLAENVSIEE